jgi:hypothetical protein
MKPSCYFIFNQSVLLCPNMYATNLHNSLRTCSILILVLSTALNCTNLSYNRSSLYSVTCIGARMTKITGSSSDGWIYWHFSHKYYSTIADLHNLQFTIPHALGFSVFTSCFLTTELNTWTITSNHYEVFLPFLVQSPWNLRTQLKLISAASGLVLHSHSTDNAANTVLLQTTQKTQVMWKVSTVGVWRHCACVSCTDTKKALLLCCVTSSPRRYCVYCAVALKRVA